MNEKEIKKKIEDYQAFTLFVFEKMREYFGAEIYVDINTFKIQDDLVLAFGTQYLHNIGEESVEYEMPVSFLWA